MHLLAAHRLTGILLSDLPMRWAHSQQVLSQARKLAPVVGNARVVLAVSAILHDVGYASAAVDTGQHMIDGARYLARLGCDPLVCSLVAYHSSSEWEAAELGLAPALAEFERPPSDLLDAITFCDLTSGPDGAPVDATSRLDEVLCRYAPDHVVHRAVSAARPALLAMVARVEERLAARPGGYPM
ncbi:HD domain-containing protein [Kitasatospora purpeofusca]|uniref:HD domain-containing protein n=2 Tax=Kitasatospora purpeofusca TaxID=67352 RepID=UPI002B1D7A6D|nr:HD domain-containing protein [Kitasatospora purpeofusca]